MEHTREFSFPMLGFLVSSRLGELTLVGESESTYESMSKNTDVCFNVFVFFGFVWLCPNPPPSQLEEPETKPRYHVWYRTPSIVP